MRELFQFLIGRLDTPLNGYEPPQGFGFQFLIGRLDTDIVERSGNDYLLSFNSS
mgnify:CR=1 FL=1